MIRLTASNLDRNEIVVFYPSYGRLLSDHVTWRVTVSGAVYEPGEISLRKRLLLRLLRRVMKIEAVELDSEIFRERIQAFVAETEKGKRIWVQVGSRRILLQKKSKKNGQFSGTFRLTVDEVEQLRQEGHVIGDRLRFQLLTSTGDPRIVGGEVHLVEPTGLSVVSDIDDTIKHSQVTSRRELLANTFLREFRSIAGMAHIYRQWAETGAVFHYVSSSPWQLFSPLEQLCREEGFPVGTFHLRSFRLRDHMLRHVFVIRRQGKAAEIRALLKAFPKRQFILVGDSGEKDPEIYSKISHQFPTQVSAIYIRELDDRPVDDERRAKLQEHLGPARFATFSSSEELEQLIEETAAVLT